MFNERRKHSRVQILLPTAAWAGTVRYDVTLVNTSAGGAFLVCRAAPPVGSVVEVHLRPEGDRGPLVSVMARVVFEIPRGGFSQPGVGVAWLNAHCAGGVETLRRALRILLHVDGVHVEDRADTAVCTFTGEEVTDALVPRPSTAPMPRAPSGAVAAHAGTRHAGAAPIPDVAKTLVMTPGQVLAVANALAQPARVQAMPSAEVVEPKPAEAGPPAPPAMVPPAPAPPPVRVSAAIAMPAIRLPAVAVPEMREAPRRVFAAGVAGPALDHTPVLGSDLAAMGLPVLGMFAPDAAAADRAAGRTWPIGAFDAVTPVIANEPTPVPTTEPTPAPAAPSPVETPAPQPPRVRPGARLRAPSVSIPQVAAEPMPVVAALPSPAEPARAETPPRHRSVLQRVRNRADSSGFHAFAAGPMSTPMPELPDIVDPEQLPEHGALAQSYLPLPQAEPVARVLPPPLIVPASRPSQPLIVPASRPGQPLIVPASRPSQPLRMVDAPVQPAQKPLNEATVAYTRPSQIMEKLLSIPAPVAEPAWPVGVPESLAERYGELKRLGHGGLGVVYRALDLLLDRQVVLKFMAQTALSSDMARRYFLREVKLAASLSHINIIQIYDIGRADAVLYYAMEFVDGRALTAWLPPRAPIADHGFLFSVMSQLADALDYAHGRNVLHRDVKPDNVIVGRDGTVKLFDFGLARAIDQGFGEQSVLIGTPHYMAPEQLMGGVVGRHTDIYSLGIVLYRMLSGMLPFSEGNVFVAQATQPVPDPRCFQPDLPAAVVPLLEKMLAKKPGERYDSCRDAIVALHAALFG